MNANTTAEPPTRTPEQVQREHELNKALEAARLLQERLEMLGDRQASVRWLRTLRNDLTTEIARCRTGQVPQ